MSQKPVALVVKDDSSAANIIRIVLEQKGYEVRSKSSAAEILAEAVAMKEKDETPALLISDQVQLQPVNDKNLIDETRAAQLFPTLPIVIIGGRERIETTHQNVAYLEEGNTLIASLNPAVSEAFKLVGKSEPELPAWTAKKNNPPTSGTAGGSL